MASVTFYTTPAQNAFTTETRVGDYEVTYALGAAEPTALVIRARYWQTRADYTRPAENSTLSYGAATAYFINDDGFRDILAGVVEWTRTWATVPASWSEPESFSYTYPAFTGATTYGTAFDVTAITAVSGGFELATTATGISVNDSIYISLSYTRGSISQRFNTFTRATAVSSGASVTIPAIFSGTGAFSGVSGTVTKSTSGRSTQVTLMVGSRLAHDYALSSTAALDTDLPISQSFTPISSAGLIVTTLSTGTATLPSSTAYAQLVSNGGELVAECERKRYMGNIYVRITRWVPAQ